MNSSCSAQDSIIGYVDGEIFDYVYVSSNSNETVSLLFDGYYILTDGSGFYFLSQFTNSQFVDIVNCIPSNTPTPTPTPGPTATPTPTPEMASLFIDIVMGYDGISFGGVTYTSDTTISVVKNQQYSITAFSGSGLFQNWEGTNVNLPVPNSSNTIVTITGDTATLKAVFPEMTPTPTPTVVSSTATPTPTPTETPTPTPTTVASCSGKPYVLSNLLTTPSSGESLWISSTMPATALNLVNILGTNSSVLYFNEIDNDGTDQTTYFGNAVGTSFTVTLCQNGNSAIYSGTNIAMVYDGSNSSYFLDSTKLSLVQSSPVSTFTFGEVFYIDILVSGQSTPTPTPTSTTEPTNVPTDTPTPTPEATSTPEPATATPAPTGVPTDTPTPTPLAATSTPTPEPTSTATPLPATSTPTPTPTSGSAPMTVTITEVGSNVVMSASGTVDLSGLTLVSSSAGPFGNGGLGISNATFVCGASGSSGSSYSGFTSVPSNFGSGSGLPHSSGTGQAFGVIMNMAPPYLLIVPTGYTSGANISSSQTFTGQTLSSLGLTNGTYTYTWSGGSIDVVVGIGLGGPTPTPTPTSIGGGIGAWYFYSDEGGIFDAQPPLSDGNSIFLIRNNETNEVTETFNPNKSNGVNEIYFNLDDSNGTNYTTQFTELATNGGTISITQGANTVTYTSTTPGTFFADTIGGIFTIQTGPATQTVTSANPFVYADPISITFGS
jgi:hypothetical protein